MAKEVISPEIEQAILEYVKYIYIYIIFNLSEK